MEKQRLLEPVAVSVLAGAYFALLSAIATGNSRIRGILQSADVQSTAAVLRNLGAAIPPLSGDFKVRGIGFDGLRARDQFGGV